MTDRLLRHSNAWIFNKQDALNNLGVPFSYPKVGKDGLGVGVNVAAKQIELPQLHVKRLAR